MITPIPSGPAPSALAPAFLGSVTDDAAYVRSDPLAFGVGARITAAVMSDRYVEVITGALAAVHPVGLVVEPGDVSTYVGGAEADLLDYLTRFCAEIAASGAHASITVHLSRGCPGEVVCDLPGGAGPRAVEVPGVERTGRLVAAEWALYPLEDAAREGVEPDHMRHIYAAIEDARAHGTVVASEHFVTRLEGDLGTVLKTVMSAWGWGRPHRAACHQHARLSPPACLRSARLRPVPPSACSWSPSAPASGSPSRWSLGSGRRPADGLATGATGPSGRGVRARDSRRRRAQRGGLRIGRTRP